jgi:phage shock protein PspC (stress-responsive transcriptional regulator)
MWRQPVPQQAAAMTETTTAPPPPPDPPPLSPAPALVRPLDGRILRGVAAGVGRYTGTDPVLWRVLLAVLAVFGGSGIVLYLAGWLLLPEEGAAQSPGQRLLGAHRNPVAVLGLVGLAVIALAVVVGADEQALVPLLVVGGLAYLVLRERRDPAGPPATAGWAAPPAWTSPATHGPAPVLVPPAPRRRSNLGRLTLSAVVLVVGLLLLAASLGVDGVTGPRVVATALLVTGAGLLVGARWGRARGLLVLAVVLALLLPLTAAVERSTGTTSGDRTWVVAGSAEHRLGAGQAVLDLRGLAGTSRTVDVEARVGLGELLVLVPEDLRVDVDAEVDLGQITFVDVEGARSTEEGTSLERRQSLGAAGPHSVQLDVEVGAGELEVRRVAAK